MITWRRYDGYDPGGRVAVRVVESSQGWRAYLRGDPVDSVDYPGVGAAQAVAEAAWVLAPEPAVRPRRERFGRKVANRPVDVPHPAD